MRCKSILFTKVAAVLLIGLAKVFVQAAESPIQAHPPTVKIISPPSGANFTAPVDLRIYAEASDVDGKIKAVEFFAGTNSLGIALNVPSLGAESTGASSDAPGVRPIPVYQLTWTNAPPGEYALRAVATDDQGRSGISGEVRIKVNKPEPPMQTVVNIVVTDALASEGSTSSGAADTASFAVYRTGSTDLPLEVFYHLGGTASNGVDYRELTRKVTIPAGSRLAEIVVDPIDDAVVEGTETVVVTLEEPACIAIFPPPPGCYAVGRLNEAKAEIRDNDKPPANLPPFVSLMRPLAGQVFIAPADISLAAVAGDSDGFIKSVEFFEGEHRLGFGTNNPAVMNPGGERNASPVPLYELTWTNVPPGEYVLAAVATDNQGATTRSKSVRVTVTTKEPVPVVSIEAKDAEAAEEGASSNTPNTASFVLHRTGETNFPLTVHYRLSGTATMGADYKELPGKVTIPEGSRSAEIVIMPLDDKLVEGKETVVVTLIGSECVDLFPPPKDCYRVAEAHEARAVILDNDLSPINLPPKVGIVRPRAGEVFFAPADIELAAEAKDADGKVKSVEFFEGKNSLGVVANDDGNDDLDRLFRLKWPNVGPGDYVLTAVATDNQGAKSTSESVAIKVIPKPVPRPIVTIKATDPVASEMAVGLGPLAMPIRLDMAVFTVARTGETNTPLVVRYTVSGTAENGVDYEKLSGELTIPKGSSSAEILVLPIDDQLAEDTETVEVTLTIPPCALEAAPSADCYRVGEARHAVAFIHDNDKPNSPPKVAIVKPARGSQFGAPANIEIKAEAADADGWVSLVEFFAGDKKIGEQGIVFVQRPPSGLPQSFGMKWTNVPPGKYVLTAKATDDRGGTSVSGPVEISVVEIPPRVVVNVQATDAAAAEGEPTADDKKTATFKVTRSGGAERPLVVYYKLSGQAKNGEDYRELPGKITIPQGALSADIVVEPIDDKTVEGTEDVILTIEPPACIDLFPPPPECYLVGKDSRAIAFIKDNDTIASASPEVAITEPHDGATFKANADILIVAEAKDPDGWVQRVEFFANDKKIGEVILQFIKAPPPGEKQVFSFKWSNVAPGKYKLAVRGTDNANTASMSKPVEIQVGDVNVQTVVTIQARDPHAAESNGSGKPNTATFAVRRTGSLDTELKVYYSISGTASNGVDYVRLPGVVTIPRGDKAVDITLTPIDDNIPEKTETVALKLELPPEITAQAKQNAPYAIGRQDKAAAFIEDNDGEHRGCVRVHDGHFVVCMPGLKGESFRVEVSEDLTHWEVVEHNIAEEDDLHFVDPEAPQHKQRYYRVIHLEGGADDE